MRWRRVALTGALLALVGALLAGCGGTSAANGQPSAAAAVHMSGYAQGDGPRANVILTGAIGDFGEAVYVRPDGTVDPEHASELELRLARGTFRIRVADLDKKLVGAFGNARFNKSTGSGHVTATDTTPIVSGSGTGSYKAISGSFVLSITIDEIVKQPATSPAGAALAQVDILSGSGDVSLP